jgi:hypothetical protein
MHLTFSRRRSTSGTELTAAFQGQGMINTEFGLLET